MIPYPSATSLGCYAQKSLAGKTEGKVMGVTSNGLFLLFGKYSIFVTTNQHQSPFNIILPIETTLPADLAAGDTAYYSLNELLIPERQWILPLADVPVWTSPRPIPLKNSEDEQAAAAKQLLIKLQQLDVEKGFIFLGKTASADTTEQAAIRHATLTFSKAFQNNDQNACLEAATALLGKGGGLTPSGDDWLAGFMLYHSCHSLAQNKNPRAFVNSLGAELVFSANRLTTFISANRIDAALLGWTEEFFLSTINYLFGDTTNNTASLAQNLIHFGHSSGVDTYMGIYSACIALG
jgi:hypothetical protein